MSYELLIVEGYEAREATNDQVCEELTYVSSSNGNIFDLRMELDKRETLEAFKKILTKEIIFD